MSDLKKLIKELCPNGVKFEKVDDLVTIKRGERVTKNNLIDNGEYKVISGGAEPMGFYNKYNREKNTITISSYGYAGYVNFITEDFWANDVCLCIFPKSIIDNKFLYYSLKNKQDYFFSKTTKAIPDHIPTEVIKETRIAVPPLEIQHKIVQILDGLTLLTDELTTELTTEIEKRKKQFDFYFKHIMFNKSYPIVKIEDIGQVKMCRRILKSQTNKEGGVPFYKIGTFGKEPDAYISEEIFKEYVSKYSYPKKGDILISCSGTIGRTVVFDGKPSYFQDSNIVWLEHCEDKILNDYLKYCYMMSPWKIAAGGTIARLYNDNILKAEIPLPGIEEQKRIVGVLNNFEKIYNSLSLDLSAEIEKRQKQYEYYRDKLLNFEEVEVSE